MDTKILQTIAKKMVAPGKGILAIDESHPTCQKRFESLGVECTEETRREYRELLVTAPGIEAAVAGYIFFDETIRQKTRDNVPFTKVLIDKGIMPGIKVDTGAHDLAIHPGEKVTEGLDGLRGRLTEYKKLGAKFAKWRAVITIKGNELPSTACLMANAHALARYAALVQEAGLVPIVEPEILLDGNHTIDRCYDVSARAWQIVFAQLKEQGVYLPGTILKTSMVLSGKDCPTQADLSEVTSKTIKCLVENVPHELAGVVFLSGGQSDEDSTIRLDAMNKKNNLPWPLSFSYGRGIQAPALKIWAANRAEKGRAQRALVHRSKMNGLAALGKYDPSLEKGVI